MSAKNEVKLSQVRIDGGTQPRSSIDQAIVADYAERIEAGDTFPLCDVFFDGAEYWLADGFHRYHGHKKAGSKVLPSNIHSGTQRDAVLFSCGANRHHGLRRTNEDKRRAVETLLKDAEWGSRSDRWVAEACGVSDKTVATVRSELRNSAVEPESDGKPAAPQPPKPPTRRQGKDGKTRTTPAPKATTAPPPATTVVVETTTKPGTNGKAFDEAAGTEHLKRLRWWLDERGAKFGKGATWKFAIAQFNALAETVQAWRAEKPEKVERTR